MIPRVSQPRMAAALATARMTALSPGQSPPPVTMPIFLFMGIQVRFVSELTTAADRCHARTLLGDQSEDTSQHCLKSTNRRSAAVPQRPAAAQTKVAATLD